MKHLLPLILLCALLCGCAEHLPSEQTSVPVSDQASAGMASALKESGGAVREIPLNLQQVRGIRVYQEGLLLFSGQESTTLTLLDPAIPEQRGCLTLGTVLDAEDPSLRFHGDRSLSFYNPAENATLVLAPDLSVAARIEAPDAISGTPILSEDRNTLYYCTASQVRALDLQTGIHRCLTEICRDRQTLTGLVLHDRILCCRAGGETLFLSTEDGRQLGRSGSNPEITGYGEYFFAVISAGTYRLGLFGKDQGAMDLLVPETLTGDIHFLPEQMSALTVSSEDTQTHLECYALDTGGLAGQLTLDGFHTLRSADALPDGTLVLLFQQPEEDRQTLLLWSPDAEARGGNICYTVPCQPDEAGWSACQARADALGREYGIQISLGPDVLLPQSRDYRFTAEPLVPLLERELTLLETRLAAFPPEVLQATAAHYSQVHLSLVRSITDAGGKNLSGIQLLEEAEAWVVIATGTFAEQALYHNLFHLMETHIFARSKALDNWEELNPAGFRYDYNYAANEIRDSGVYLFEDHRAFVNTHSMSFPREDRATILEYAMLPGMEALFRPAVLQQKLQTLCTGIREAYGLSQWREPLLWEQYLQR